MQDDHQDDRASRRRFLGICTTAFAATTAGCVGNLGTTESSSPTDSSGTRSAGDGQSPEEPHSADSSFSEETKSRALETGKALRESVVVVQGTRPNGRTSTAGTGWHIGDGYFVTNGHVAEAVDSLEAYTLDGTTHALEPVSTSLQPDIAVLDTPDSDSVGLPALDVGDEALLERDQPVLQVGHPSLVGEWVIAIGRFVAAERMGVLTTTASRSGYSGAPLATLDGTVVGLTTGGVSRNRSGGRNDEPQPDEDVVHEDFDDEIYSHHVPGTTVEETFDEWTS